jgi:hypothetical protein
MKAIVQTGYGSPDVLLVKEVAEPTLEDTQVLVQVYATSINAGDYFSMRGSPWLVRFFVGFPRPSDYILGWDVAGRVVAVGRAVTQFQPGDAVFGAVSHAFMDISFLLQLCIWAPGRAALALAWRIEVLRNFYQIPRHSIDSERAFDYNNREYMFFFGCGRRYNMAAPRFLMWYDDDPKLAIKQKIAAAIEAYEQRFAGLRPNLVLVNETELVQHEGVEVRGVNTVRRNNVWVGFADPEAAA